MKFSLYQSNDEAFLGRQLREGIESRADRVRHQGHRVGSCAIAGHEVQGEGRPERKVPGE